MQYLGHSPHPQALRPPSFLDKKYIILAFSMVDIH